MMIAMSYRIILRSLGDRIIVLSVEPATLLDDSN